MNFNESTNNTEFNQILFTTSFSNVNYDQASERFVNNTRRQPRLYESNFRCRSTEFTNIPSPNYANDTPPDSNSMMQQYDNFLSLINSMTITDIYSAIVGNNLNRPFNLPTSPPHYFLTSIIPKKQLHTSY